MPFLFETEEHLQLRRTVRRFAEAHIAPFGADWRKTSCFRRAISARPGSGTPGLDIRPKLAVREGTFRIFSLQEKN